MPSHKKHHNQHHHNHHHPGARSPGRTSNAGEDGHARDAEVFLDVQQDVNHHSKPDAHHGDGKGIEHMKVEDGGIPHQGFHNLSPNDMIANLKELNEMLVKEVCSSQTAMGELDEKVEALEEQVQEKAARADALAMENNFLEEEKHKLEPGEEWPVQGEAASWGCLAEVLRRWAATMDVY
ncbi:hypothetical protein L7F22_060933 [Adiantum nelumboides]|nr:hypothetical protein [Adiantum nelumboides]